ncbi:MAG: M48 family metallopeptidase [Candidatus Taylorbacteria bacterium]|nr:M48 family metallopeptidase [Candidatus Taylorbacteria bacterium]
MKKGKKAEYLKYRGHARELAHRKVGEFCAIYNFKCNKIAIRNQKTRWGSCSKRGNLNFSYRIALLPPHLSNYIIAHEVCHLGEFNHSKNFWNLVARTIPDYAKLRKELNQKGRIMLQWSYVKNYFISKKKSIYNY